MTIKLQVPGKQVVHVAGVEDTLAELMAALRLGAFLRRVGVAVRALVDNGKDVVVVSLMAVARNEWHECIRKRDHST